MNAGFSLFDPALTRAALVDAFVEVGLGYLQMGRGVTTLNNALLLRTLP